MDLIGERGKAKLLSVQKQRTTVVGFLSGPRRKTHAPEENKLIAHMGRHLMQQNKQNMG